MAADPFGGGFYNDIGAKLQGPGEITAGAESIVHDQWQVIVFGQRNKFFKIRNVQPGVADGLQINGLGVLVDQRHEAVHIIAVGKAGFDAEPFEGHLELVVGASVEEGGGHEIVTGLQDVVQRDELRGLSRTHGQGGHAAFQRRDPFLEYVRGGVHDARVDVPELPEAEQVCRVRGIVKRVRGGLVNGDGPGPCGGVDLLARVELQGLKMQLAHVLYYLVMVYVFPHRHGRCPKRYVPNQKCEGKFNGKLN